MRKVGIQVSGIAKFFQIELVETSVEVGCAFSVSFVSVQMMC